MSRIEHVIREFARNLYRHPGMLLGSFLSLTFLFLLFDLYWIAAGTSEQFYVQLLSRLRTDVFVSEAHADQDLEKLKDSLQELAGVRSASYISREMARKELSRMVGMDLLVGYDSANPLPRSFVLALDAAHLNVDSMYVLEERLMKLESIDTVFYSRGWLKKAEQTRATIREFGLILGALILLAALISSANAMRLTARTRAVGFHQMRLLGAGRRFLAAPFLIEGFLMGGMSAATGWFVIYYSLHRIEFTQIEIILPIRQDILIFCAIASMLGMLSVLFGLRKLVR